MPYDNKYNRSIAEQLHRINQNYITHSHYIGGAILGGTHFSDSDSDSDYSSSSDESVKGEGGFAEATHLDTGFEPTVGATKVEGGKMLINTHSQKLTGNGERAIGSGERAIGSGERVIGGDFWNDFKSGFDSVVDTVGNVANAASKVIPVVQTVSGLLGHGEEGLHLNKHDLTPVDNLPSSSMGGSKKKKRGGNKKALQSIENVQQQIKDANEAFGGRKVSGPALKFINEVSPYLKLGKSLLERYDKDGLKAVPKLLLDVHDSLSKEGKGRMKKLGGQEKAELVKDALEALQEGKNELKGGGLIGSLFNMVGLGKKKKMGKGLGLLGPLSNIAGAVTGIPMLAHMGNAVGNILGLGEPAMIPLDHAAKQEIADLPKAQAILEPVQEIGRAHV